MAPSIVPVAPPPPTVVDEQDGPEKVTSKDSEPSTAGVEAADPVASPAPTGETTEVRLEAGDGKKKKKKKKSGVPGAAPKVKGHVSDSRLLKMVTLLADLCRRDHPDSRVSTRVKVCARLMAANFSAEYVVDGPLTKDEAETELALYDPYVNSKSSS
jgi:hypothetical protein